MFNYDNNIIETNKNRKKKKKKRKERKREQRQEKIKQLENYYDISAKYIDSKELAPESVILGPEYSYSDYIKGPKEIGMSSRGEMRVLEKDVNGLFAYVDLLIKGKSKAIKGPGVLGPQNFVPTGATCQLDVSPTQQRTVQRYIYNSFKPTGNIPIDGDDGEIKDARGLIPGLLENTAKLNPMDMFQSFLDTNPTCMMLKMPVTKTRGSVSAEEHPVSILDIGQMDPCTFVYYNKKNPVTGATCGGGGGRRRKKKKKKKKRRSGFENLYDKTENIYNKTYVEIDDMFDTGELYIATMGVIFIYIILRGCNIDLDK